MSDFLVIDTDAIIGVGMEVSLGKSHMRRVFPVAINNGMTGKAH